MRLNSEIQGAAPQPGVSPTVRESLSHFFDKTKSHIGISSSCGVRFSGFPVKSVTPRGPCLRVTDVAHPVFPMLVLYLLSWAHRSVSPHLGPGVGCRWQRPDHLRMAEPKGKVERRGGPPSYKTHAVGLPSQWVEAPGTKPGLWSH